MRPRLFIRLPEQDHQPVVWLLQETAEGETGGAAQQGTLEDISLHATGHRVIVLIPASQVLLTHARIPSRKRQRILSALPYALEDQLATDVDKLHFALGRREHNGEVQVAVVERRRLADWLARLRACDIEPDEVVPDVLCLPRQAGSWTALQEHDHTLLRTGQQLGLSLDNDSLEVILGLLLDEQAEEQRPAAVQWYAAPDMEPAPPALAELEIQARPLESDPLGLLAHHYQGEQALNLLQGEYSRHEQLGRYWRPWRPAAALLLALLLISAVDTLSDYQRLGKERDQLRNRIERIYLDTFPEAKRVVNPRVQMERRLQGLQAGGATAAGGFLDLLRHAGPALKNTAGLELRRISYRDGRLDIALLIQDLQGLDQLKQHLAQDSGLSVEIQSASARDNRVEARLQIRGTGP
ncbi:MAG: type II secretion system protein GspL [Gammaproteobacteria bacterium]